MSDNVRMAASYTAKITTPVAPAMKAALEELARREEVPPTIIQRRAFSAYLNTQEATK